MTGPPMKSVCGQSAAYKQGGTMSAKTLPTTDISHSLGLAKKNFVNVTAAVN